MSEDVTIGPLRCIVCGDKVFRLADWVRPSSDGPIYGLHTGCSKDFGERGSWENGRPRMRPSLEQRVERLERSFGCRKLI